MRYSSSILVLLVLALQSSLAWAQQAAPRDLVNALEGAFGHHEGKRRSHAKGVCAAGTFVASKLGRELTRSPIFDGSAVQVVARFSLSGGDPNASDATRSPRGLALQLRSGGSLHQMSLLSTPVFAAATPESFLGLLRAQALDATGKRDQKRIAEYQAAHPDTVPQATWLATRPPPASFATTTYHSVHAFRFVNARGAVQLARFRFVPDEGERDLPADRVATATRDFLHADLSARLSSRPAVWKLLVQLAEPGDPTHDPTQVWPSSRRELLAGTLRISSVERATPGSCDAINFDPLVLSDGVGPSDDPILRIRSSAYAISAGRRQKESKVESSTP